ncbi:hypothetical protein ACLOJK_030914 [Asimina triloba]
MSCRLKSTMTSSFLKKIVFGALAIHYSAVLGKMHVQTHMSGQISGQVPNQSGPQLSGLAQQNGSSLPSQMPSFGAMRNSGSRDPEMALARKYMGEKIFQLFQRQHLPHQWQLRLQELVKRVEESLYRSASSKRLSFECYWSFDLAAYLEEYMNMETLEHRLQTLIKNIPSNNQNQQLPTMIPTPGMPQNSNSNSVVTSGENFSNPMSTGNLLPTVNGSSGGVHSSSFNASDGAISNGYQQSSSNIAIGSGGNNMIAAMSVPRMASQMIPTPGLNNPQSMPMNSESSNGGGFSTAESTLVSHQQQSKQYIGGPNNRMLHNLSGQMGTGMRSNLPQKPSSYSFSNGALNGGLTMIGNNIQLMNGPTVSEGYIGSSAYGNSPKPLQQFDQQHQQQLMQSKLPPSLSLAPHHHILSEF